MDLSSPGREKKKHEESNRLVNDLNASYASSSSQSRSNSSSPSSLFAPSSTESTWYKLQLGAKPAKINRKEWKCGQDCKKKKKTAIFKDSQAVEKHILRNHPDPIYNEFVCMFAWCKMAKTSPQQILDHLGQAERYDGHELKDQVLKYESIRAVHVESKEKYRVRRDPKVFAWYICLPQKEARSLSSVGAVANTGKQTDNSFQLQPQPQLQIQPQQQLQLQPQQQLQLQPQHQLQLQPQQQIQLQLQPQHQLQLQQQQQQQLQQQQQILPHGRPPDVPEAHRNTSVRPLDPDKMLTDGFSAAPG